jgi:enterochelin esterase-like enzyme
MSFWKNPANNLLNLLRSKQPVTQQTIVLQSVILNRDVTLDVYLPPDFKETAAHGYPLALFNDGQDLPRMELGVASGKLHGFIHILEHLFTQKAIPSLVAVGIHCNHERQREYGTARQADYKGRGDKAGAYTRFIQEELMPYLYRHYPLTDQASERAFAGFSLGGLSAFDIGWAHPEAFGVLGVFSGALWWRWSAVHPDDPDADRIMHDVVRSSKTVPSSQHYWFQCGTLDEEEDRNNNGVIDAIDDTLDLMAALREKGVHPAAMRYLEIQDGQHEPKTWGEAMPDFLRWAFAKASPDA